VAVQWEIIPFWTLFFFTMECKKHFRWTRNGFDHRPSACDVATQFFLSSSSKSFSVLVKKSIGTNDTGLAGVQLGCSTGVSDSQMSVTNPRSLVISPSLFGQNDTLHGSHAAWTSLVGVLGTAQANPCC